MQKKEIPMKKILVTLLLVTVIVMMMSGCSSQTVTSTTTMTVTKTVTATPSTSLDSLHQQQAISILQIYLIELSGTTGTYLIGNYEVLTTDLFKWSVTSNQNLYLVRVTYTQGSTNATIGTWTVDINSDKVSPADNNAQNAEMRLEQGNIIYSLLPPTTTTQP